MDNDTNENVSNSERSPRIVSNLSKCIYIAVGMLSLGLGIAGTALPFIPTTPFVLLTAICFGKSSDKLHNWFLSTRFYRRNLDSFAKGRGMTIRAKIKLLIAVSVFMGISFVVMHIMSAPLAARIVLAVVWLCHVLYFGFKVKTIR